MGLFTIAAAFGVGYIYGRPDGRAQLQRYLRQAREYADKPEVKRLRERGRDLAGDQMTAVKRRLDARSSGAAADSAPSDPAVAAEATVLTDRDAPTVPDPSVVPDLSVPPADSVAGFGGTTVAEDSRAVILGQGTLPPPHRPATPGPTPAGP